MSKQSFGRRNFSRMALVAAGGLVAGSRGVAAAEEGDKSKLGAQIPT